MNLNPFRPNSPAGPGMFAGRGGELLKLEAIINNTKAENPGHFMITGERGIGKTSLMLYFKSVCLGQQVDGGDQSHNYLVIDLDMDRYTTRQGFITRLQAKLERELGQDQRIVEFMKKTWDFVCRFKVMDCGIDQKASKEVHDELMFDQLAQALADVCSRVCNANAVEGLVKASYDGIVILVDEADNCPDEFGIGEFFKLLLEKLQRLECNKVCIGLVGLPHLREKLLSSHRSSLRIFEPLFIDRLGTAEMQRIISRCIENTKRKGSVATLQPDAADNLVLLSEGFPHFLHQFGHSAFDFDMDGDVTITDVNASAFGPKGALEILGDKYYRDDFYKKIQGEEYRQVLRIMAQRLDEWISKKEIREKFKGKTSTLDNALMALRDKRIILDKQGTRGVYRLQSKGFAVWITRQSADPTVQS